MTGDSNYLVVVDDGQYNLSRTNEYKSVQTSMQLCQDGQRKVCSIAPDEAIAKAMNAMASKA